MTPKEFFSLAKKHGADMVDLKFTDLLGSWQHCSFPIETWDERLTTVEAERAQLATALSCARSLTRRRPECAEAGRETARRAA